ncbi:hypothetical protein [Agrococcus sp. SCSIO52902]|uniref:hypothetical protein n=1 Tax=Agrococcus sp. SCSIO52902 TaxID=2933290 RepID=UPI001FF696EA|nr:hypothetical protein [Agrococcus sp. SCSIO52902]UOW00898.1 hypothetical protein MU522_00245 [Agrococcus sp. SCSIO52902]
MSENLNDLLASTQADVAAATAALAEAEARVAAAEEQRQLALAEEDERRRREEDARIDKLRAQLPRYQQQAEEAFAQFEATAAGRAPEAVHRSMELWVGVVIFRTLCNRIRHQILAHDAHRAKDLYDLWERKAGSWHEMLNGATSISHGGYLPGEEDDAEALAAVNALITEESATAPRPLVRDPADRSLPGPAQLGVTDPATAQVLLSTDPGIYNLQISFVGAFDQAVTKRAEEEVREMLQTPYRGRQTNPQTDTVPSRPPTRDERVAQLLAATLRRGRGKHASPTAQP